jgi:hypothetical protein
MKDDMIEGDDAFIERISGKLRAVEIAPDDLERRVMADVRSIRDQLTVPAAAKPWLMRPRSFRASPVAALALAAGFAALVLGVASLVRTPGADRTSAAAVASVDTVHVVRFLLADAEASSISLVGTFNQWDKGATPLRQVAPGIWAVQLPLSGARHEYAFVVRDERGERWMADPAALSARDEFGAESSIIDLTVISSS